MCHPIRGILDSAREYWLNTISSKLAHPVTRTRDEKSHICRSLTRVVNVYCVRREIYQQIWVPGKSVRGAFVSGSEDTDNTDRSKAAKAGIRGPLYGGGKNVQRR